MAPEQAVGAPVESGFTHPGTYERVNVLRGEFGVDHNFFLPAINPAASFLAVVSLVFQANLDERGDKDFRTPIIKPSAIDRQLAGGPLAGQVAGRWCDDPDADVPPDQRQCDYVNQDAFEAFVQTTLRTDFMGGRLSPALTAIGTFRGALAFAPALLYRFSDSFLFDVKYINVHTFGTGNNGYTPGVGLIRDRDQLWFRATYQLN